MKREEFINLVWRFEEIMMHRDYLNSQIGNCGGQCQGNEGEDEGLCPTCCEIFMQVQEEDTRLAGNKELDEVLKILKKACDEDMSGEYERLLEESRESRVFH